MRKKKISTITFLVEISKLQNKYSFIKCFSCRFEKIMGIDKEYLDGNVKELSGKEKLCYYLSKNFDEKLNQGKLIGLFKK